MKVFITLAQREALLHAVGAHADNCSEDPDRRDEAAAADDVLVALDSGWDGASTGLTIDTDLIETQIVADAAWIVIQTPEAFEELNLADLRSACDALGIDRAAYED